MRRIEAKPGRGPRLRVINRELMLSCKLIVNDDPTSLDVSFDLQAASDGLVVLVSHITSFNATLDLQSLL